MKFFAAFALLVAGVTTLHQGFVAPRNEITDHLIGRIEEISIAIRSRGLDPLHIRKETRYVALPVPVIFTAVGLVEEVLFNGLSNIIIHEIDFDAVNSVVTFHLSIPHIHLSAYYTGGEIILLDTHYEGELSGSFDIRDVHLRGSVSISVGAVDIVANSADLEASVGSIESAIKLEIGSLDLSERVNNFFNVRLTGALQNLKNEVEELIGIYLVRYINRE